MSQRICASCGHNWPRPGSLAGSASCAWCGCTTAREKHENKPTTRDITKELVANVDNLCAKAYSHAIVDAMELLTQKQDIDVNNLLVELSMLSGKGPCAYRDKHEEYGYGL